MQQIIDEVSRCLQSISPKLSNREYAKLHTTKVPRVHQFTAESAELCNPEKIFVSDDSPDDIAYIRRMVIETAYIRNIISVARAANAECIFGILQGINPRDDLVLYKVLTTPGEVIFSNVLVEDGKPRRLGMGCELPKDGVNYTG